MARKGTGAYPADWKHIAQKAKAQAGFCCVRCLRPHEPEEGYTLTVHHLDMDKSNSAWWNLLPLCQRCHLSIQGRVDLARPWVMLEHSEWIKPYIAGWYAKRYLGRDITEYEAWVNNDEYLALERLAVLEQEGS